MLCIRYKSGTDIDVSFLPDTTENVILVLNGRDNNTVSNALQWLNDLPNIPSIQVSYPSDFHNDDLAFFVVLWLSLYHPDFCCIV